MLTHCHLDRSNKFQWNAKQETLLFCAWNCPWQKLYSNLNTSMGQLYILTGNNKSMQYLLQALSIWCLDKGNGIIRQFTQVRYYMMTSSNGNIFRFTGPRWIHCTKASDAEFDVFFDLRLNQPLSKQWWAGDLIRYRAHYNVTVMRLACRKVLTSLIC